MSATAEFNLIGAVNDVYTEKVSLLQLQVN
jgi:hypothetical protein